MPLIDFILILMAIVYPTYYILYFTLDKFIQRKWEEVLWS